MSHCRSSVSAKPDRAGKCRDSTSHNMPSIHVRTGQTGPQPAVPSPSSQPATLGTGRVVRQRRCAQSRRRSPLPRSRACQSPPRRRRPRRSLPGPRHQHSAARQVSSSRQRVWKRPQTHLLTGVYRRGASNRQVASAKLAKCKARPAAIYSKQQGTFALCTGSAAAVLQPTARMMRRQQHSRLRRAKVLSVGRPGSRHLCSRRQPQGTAMAAGRRRAARRGIIGSGAGSRSQQPRRSRPHVSRLPALGAHHHPALASSAC